MRSMRSIKFDFDFPPIPASMWIVRALTSCTANAARGKNINYCNHKIWMSGRKCLEASLAPSLFLCYAYETSLSWRFVFLLTKKESPSSIRLANSPACFFYCVWDSSQNIFHIKNSFPHPMRSSSNWRPPRGVETFANKNKIKQEEEAKLWDSISIWERNLCRRNFCWSFWMV